MGMILSLVQFPAEKLQEYLRNPVRFEKDLASLENSQQDPSCYLDKAWEAVHYLLTGDKLNGYLSTGSKRTNLQVSAMAIYSDQFFDQKQDLGLGPASYLTPDQVSEINTILSKTDSSFVKDRYDPSEMDSIGIYPRFWSKDPELLNYVADSFAKLEEFYADAASKSHAVASYLS